MSHQPATQLAPNFFTRIKRMGVADAKRELSKLCHGKAVQEAIAATWPKRDAIAHATHGFVPRRLEPGLEGSWWRLDYPSGGCMELSVALHAAEGHRADVVVLRARWLLVDRRGGEEKTCELLSRAIPSSDPKALREIAEGLADELVAYVPEAFATFRECLEGKAGPLPDLDEKEILG